MRQMGHLTQYMHVRDGLKHAPAGVKIKGPQKKILARGAITITRFERSSLLRGSPKLGPAL